MKDTAPKRILREIKRFNDNPQKNIISFHIQEENILKLIAKIIVTDKCPYKGGKFDFEFEFCHDYPFKPPKIKLINKIYHPNFKGDKTKIYHYSFLSKEENVPKFDILGYNWSPDKSIIDILKIIYQVLINPDPMIPINSDCAFLMRKDRKKYEKIAKEWTAKYAYNIFIENK